MDGLCAALLGPGASANMFALGFALQRGLLPISRAALARAIAAHGLAVETNLDAMEWGRRAAADLPRLQAALAAAARAGAAPELAPGSAGSARAEEGWAGAEATALRERLLREYEGGGEGRARRYAAMVAEVRAGEEALLARGAGHQGAAEAGAAGSVTAGCIDALYRLMAPKDEYEVARLLLAETGPGGAAPAGQGARTFHLSPPWIAPRDRTTGLPRKVAVPEALAMPLLRVLRALRFLRDTPLDLFRCSSRPPAARPAAARVAASPHAAPCGAARRLSEERRVDRALLARYEQDMAAVAQQMVAAPPRAARPARRTPH